MRKIKRVRSRADWRALSAKPHSPHMPKGPHDRGGVRRIVGVLRRAQKALSVHPDASCNTAFRFMSQTYCVGDFLNWGSK